MPVPIIRKIQMVEIVRLGAQYRPSRLPGSPRVLKFIQVVGKHWLLSIIVDEGVPFSDLIELLETPREELSSKRVQVNGIARSTHGKCRKSESGHRQHTHTLRDLCLIAEGESTKYKNLHLGLQAAYTIGS